MGGDAATKVALDGAEMEAAAAGGEAAKGEEGGVKKAPAQIAKIRRICRVLLTDRHSLPHCCRCTLPLVHALESFRAQLA